MGRARGSFIPLTKGMAFDQRYRFRREHSRPGGDEHDLADHAVPRCRSPRDDFIMER